MGEIIRIQLAGGEIIAATFEDIARLHAKISEASANIARIDKDSRNTFHNYDYTSYSALAAAANHAFAEHKLTFGVGVKTVSTGQFDDGDGKSKMALTTSYIEATLTDTETGATRIYYWVGITETGATRIYYWVGMGSDSQDKGAAKALTNGIKYGLMRSLLISDQDADPDDGEQQSQQQSRGQLQPQHGRAARRVPKFPPRPWDAETAKRAILAKVQHINDDTQATGEFRNFVARHMNDLFDADPTTKNAKRHSVLLYLFGIDTSAKLTKGQCKALRAWCVDETKDNDGQTILLPNEHAIQEAAAMARAYEAGAGQQEMGL